MATVNTNDKQSMCFDDSGGSITITDGANDCVIMNCVAGTLNITPGRRQLKKYDDHSVLQTPLLGRPQPTKLSFDVRYTGEVDATALEKQLLAEGANGIAKLYTIVVKIPDYQGAATGISHTYTRCYVDEGNCDIKGGEKFDTMMARFESLDHNVVPVAY